LIWSLLVAYFKQQKVSGAGMEREKGWRMAFCVNRHKYHAWDAYRASILSHNNETPCPVHDSRNGEWWIVNGEMQWTPNTHKHTFYPLTQSPEKVKWCIATCLTERWNKWQYNEPLAS
jgi:hypothetical protein